MDLSILHVDDDLADHELTKAHIARLSDDLNLSWASSGKQALELTARQDFDCIISDYQMPGMTGLDLLFELRKSGNTTPFIFLTGQGNEEVAVQALRSGADDYFTKDERLAHYNRLVHSIRNAVLFTHQHTEKLRVERSLSESEQKYSRYVNSCPLAFFVADESGNYLEVNEAACAMLGYSQAELLNMSIADILPESTGDQDNLGKVKELGRFRRERKLKTKSGELIDVNLEAVKLNENRFMAFVSDITERKRAERRLEENRKLLKQAESIASLGSWIIDLGSGEVTASEQAYEIYGIEPGKPLMVEDIRTIPLEEYRTMLDEEMKELFGGGTYDVEFKIARVNDGAERWIHSKALYEKNKNRVIGYIQDVTRQKELEAQLDSRLKEPRRKQLESVNAELKKARDNIDLHHRLDRAFILSDESEAFANVLDILKEEFDSTFGFFGYIDDQGDLICPSLTRDIWDKCQISDKSIRFPKKSWGGIWGKSLEEKSITIKNDTLNTPAGHIKLENAMAVAICLGDRLIGQFALAQRDTPYGENDRQKAEEIAVNLAPIMNSVIKRFEYLEKLKAKNAELEAFTYAVSHDLKAPIRQIRSFYSILTESHLDEVSEDGRRLIAFMGEAASNLSDVVDSLLWLSRVDRAAIDKQKVNISAIARSVYQSIDDGSRKISFQVDEDITATTDANLIRIALQNLIGNAWKYTLKKNEAEISVRKSTGHDQDKLIIEVSDNGAGFRPELADKLFEPFFRGHSDPEFQGLGIGLSTVARIADRLGGRVWAEGEQGKGTCFYLALPQEKDSSVKTG